ncbi:hypothetical protein ACHAXN_008708 [Cyclotella atomus]
MHPVNISILLLLCSINGCISSTAPSRPSTTFPYYQHDTDKPLPYNLRGGSTVSATKLKQKRRQRKRPQLIQNVHQITIQLHHNTEQQLKQLQSQIDEEWAKFLANLPKLQFKQSNSKLDAVCHSFSSVYANSRIDTASLLKACRAHLSLMKSAGSSLKLVAKDLESNLNKAEKLYNSHPECHHLSSLLELERGMNIHNGSVLKDPSAAMGLLWIRRSLSFQSDLYASLLTKSIHPREAAMMAYNKHLKPYHGWALGKLFSASLTQMPEREAFIAKFGGVGVDELNEASDREVVKKLRSLVESWDPMLDCWKEDFDRLGLEDIRRV